VNCYQAYVRQLARLVREGREFPLGGFPKPAHPDLPADAPRALIFAPHPDDEVIIGGLALRLRRELGWRVINVAVTQGSNRARQATRWAELQLCCDHIGFELLATAPGGLKGIAPGGRTTNPVAWGQAVERIREILTEHSPAAIFFPHDDDWNATHIGTHQLVVDALEQTPAGFSCLTMETEFWGAMAKPNLLVESSEAEVTDLITALSFHAGEVRRNPYHLRMPAWMIDNVRRGGELVGGQGAAPPDFLFGTLYRLRRWKGGDFQKVLSAGRFVGSGDSLKALLSY
jgi:LmbE family N-acetylglucosaminyl deacetylase